MRSTARATRFARDADRLARFRREAQAVAALNHPHIVTIFSIEEHDAVPFIINQAHIHFGERWQAGGISVFLCTNLGNGPAGTQLCPAAPATITGTLTPADVIGPAAQGIAAGEFDELLDAMRNSATYVNVHTSKYRAGEIRAHIH